jgi:hypothetical protein
MSDSPNQPITRKFLREQAAKIQAEQAAEKTKEAEEAVKEVNLDDDGNPQFKVPTTLTGNIPVTNVVIDTPPDITAGGALVTESGEVVITGSIDVSGLITATGEVEVIQLDQSDDDLDEDAKKNYIAGIPPIRISGVLAKTQMQSALPNGPHRGFNPYLSIALLTVAATLIGGGLVLAYFNGLFNF